MNDSREQILREVLDAAMNMGESERTSYLLQNFTILRRNKEGYTLFHSFKHLVEDAFIAGRSQTTWEQFKKDHSIND